MTASMAEIDLTFISKQLERVQDELRYLRTDVQLLREESRLTRGQLSRLEDTITMDIMDRIRALETR